MDPLPPDSSDEREGLLARRLRKQTRILRRCLTGLASADPEAGDELVHDARLALRRLRSALTTFAASFDPDRREPVRDELANLAKRLGPARDSQVAATRVGVLLTGPMGTTVGEAGDSLARALAERVAEAFDEARSAAGSERTQALLADLDDLVESPAPPTERGTVLRAYPRREWRRLERRVTRLAAAQDLAASEAAAHEVRKAAKRVRHAAESIGRRGKKGGAARRASRATTVAEILGVHQDTWITRQEVIALAGATGAGTAGVGTTGAEAELRGRVVAHEEAEAVQVLAEFWRAWAEYAAEDLDRARTATVAG